MAFGEIHQAMCLRPDVSQYLGERIRLEGCRLARGKGGVTKLMGHLPDLTVEVLPDDVG